MKSRSSLLLAALLVASWNAANAADAPAVPPAPVARVQPVTDTYFGESVVDRYRWMENDRDPDWMPFLRGQNDHTRAILDALPTRPALLARIQQLSGDIAAPGRVQSTGGKLFFSQRPAGASNFKLFVRENGATRLLIDPTTLDTGSSHVSLDWWTASPDGTRLVYGLSKNGSEDSTLQVMDVASGAILPERIPNTQNATPNWLDDGSGFFYNQLTGAVDTPERFLDSRERLHVLGTDPAKDPILMARGQDRNVAFEKIQSPTIWTYRHSDRALLLLSDVRSESRVFVAPLKDVVAGHAHWTPVADFADEVTDVALDGDDLYLLANHGHPRGRIVVTSAKAPDLAHAREVVPEGERVIQGMAVARDGLYLFEMDGGLGRLARLDRKGKFADIPLPFEGTIGSASMSPDAPGGVFALSGWFTPTGL